MRKLTLLRTLEYYDVPQIFTAIDATGTRYLCTLFESTEQNGYQYLGVQISEPRLMAFLGGQLDLRDAYQHPEVDNALYLVVAKENTLTAIKILQADEVKEEMLPDAGYFFDASDVVEDEVNATSDTYQLEVPVQDRITFSTLVSRMGWHALAVRKKVGKVALL